MSSHRTLPTPQPGAHIDIYLPEGLVRQYSLVNGPGQTDHYAIVVEELADSTGGSYALHNNIRVGDLLATSAPRNNFPLRRDAEHTLLIAGGIGLTPLLSMVRAFNQMGRPFALHHFVASKSEIIFKQELSNLRADVHFHIGLSPQQTADQLETLLASPGSHHHFYLCGPGPMMNLARKTATIQGWPDNAVHFEYFRNDKERDDSSCEQGACGTCRINVLEGEPKHQDVYLSETEKARGDSLMSCVSRANSEKLILDL